MRKEYLEVGQIVTTHGIKGEVRLNPCCDPDDLKAAKHLYFDGGAKCFDVERARPHKNVYVIKLAGIDMPDEAVKLRGRTAYMSRGEIPLPEGSYFIQDVIGLSVVDADSKVRYGELSDVAQTGANDIYCVKRDDGSEVWIPAIKQVIVSTDVDAGVMLVRPLKGLFDDED